MSEFFISHVNIQLFYLLKILSFAMYYLCPFVKDHLQFVCGELRSAPMSHSAMLWQSLCIGQHTKNIRIVDAALSIACRQRKQYTFRMPFENPPSRR